MTYILDDEEDVVQMLQDIFKDKGFDNCKFFTKASELLENLNESVHICILDYLLPGGLSGMDVLRKIKAVNKDCYVIGFTGYENYHKIRQWVNEGLYKLVDKNEPGYLEELAQYVKEAMDRIKDDFDWHASLLKKIKTFEEKENVKTL